MARRKADTEDFVIEEYNGAEKPQNQPAEEPVEGTFSISNGEQVKKVDARTIAEDPYISDEQKQVLFEHELKKILSKFKYKADPGAAHPVTLMRYVTVEVVNPVTKYVEVYGDKEILSEGWALYRNYIKDATVKGFLERLSAKTGIKYVTVDVLDLE